MYVALKSRGALRMRLLYIFTLFSLYIAAIAVAAIRTSLIVTPTLYPSAHSPDVLDRSNTRFPSFHARHFAFCSM